MRSGLIRAATLIAAMASLPARPGSPYFGESAKDMSEPDALRIAGRLARRQFSSEENMSLGELVRWSRSKRRARQTHPGKRGKRVRA